jgi:hypothetical protein
MIAATDGCDAIAFTTGIGENATDVRADILERLGARVDPARNETGGPRLHAEGSSLAAWVYPQMKSARLLEMQLGSCSGTEKVQPPAHVAETFVCIGDDTRGVKEPGLG